MVRPFKVAFNHLVLDDGIRLSFSERGRCWPVSYMKFQKQRITTLTQDPKAQVQPDRELYVFPTGQEVMVNHCGEFVVTDIDGNQINGKAMMLKPVTKEDVT